MDFGKFRDAYAQQALMTRPVEYEGKQKDVLETADAYADEFAQKALHILDTSGCSLDPIQLDAWLEQYESWVLQDLMPVFLSTLDVDSERSRRLLSRLNFHIMNCTFRDSWCSLLSDTPLLNGSHRVVAKETQDTLAVFSVILQQHRQKMGKSYWDDTPAAIERRSALEGAIGEYDAAIALLQLSRKNPGLHILPSPGGFEHGDNHAINSDFLVIDTTLEQAIGVQAKNNVSRQHLEAYSRDHIVLVDSTIDLDNVLSGKTHPGLIAAHQMSIIRDDDKANGHRTAAGTRPTMAARFFAKAALTERTKSQIGPASQRIGERVLHALYL